MPFGGAVLSAAREVQIPIIAALLIGACAAKARRAVHSHSVEAALSPTAMFPLMLRKPMTIAICCGECVLGAGLVLTAGQIGAGLPATVVRGCTALLFGTAVGALNELRLRRPSAGCGCFGDLSQAPVSTRTLARSILLCAGSAAAIGVPPLRLPDSVTQALVLLAVGAAELLVIAALSPEVSQLVVRLGYSDPCETRRLPVARSVASLRGSIPWRSYQRYLTAPEPADVWREGCWRFLAYPAAISGRAVEVVFGVYLQEHRAFVRAAVVETVDLVPASTTPAKASPANTTWRLASNAELLADSGATTGPMPAPQWTRVPAPTFTPALVPAPRVRVAARPARPLAHAAPRESAHLHNTAPEQQVPLRRPRFVPHAQPPAGQHHRPARGLQRSASA
jgi:Methylamine utilisation protein MauE